MTRTGLSIPARITGAAGLATLATALAAVVVLQLVRDRDATRDYRRRIEGWAAIGAWQTGESADSVVDPAGPATLAEGDPARAREQFRRWSWSILRYPEAIQVLLVSREGQVLARAPDHIGVHDLDRVLASSTEWQRETMRVGGEQREVCLAAAPIRAARTGADIGRIVVLASAEPTSAVGTPVWPYVAGIAGVYLIAVFLVGVWASRSLGPPLAVLTRGESRQGPAWVKALPSDRDDEFGAIAANVRRMFERVSSAESRADALERHVNRRVADKTKRIELHLEQAKKMAWVDSLTGLYNRRFLDERLDAVFREQLTAGEDLTLVMFDVDHFKALNDTLGHSAGDDLLAFSGELLRASLRSEDVGIRFGGDEFAILMLGASARDGATLAARLIRLFSQKASLLRVEPAVTMSAGVASLREGRARDANHLLQLADAALYQVKDQGKNAVGTAPSAGA